MTQHQANSGDSSGPDTPETVGLGSASDQADGSSGQPATGEQHDGAEVGHTRSARRTKRAERHSAQSSDPVLAQVFPDRLHVGADAFLILNGERFTGEEVVAHFGGEPMTTQVSHDRALIATVPAVFLADPGVYEVTVVVDGAESNAVDFTVEPVGTVGGE